MYNAHKITDKVAAGKLAIGSHVGFDSPFVTEMIAGCGFDFIWIDGEHSAIDRKDIQNHLMACRAAGAAGIVRVPWNDPVIIKAILDMGADGIVVPMVCSLEEAKQAAAATHYPPDGIRGMGTRRAVNYGIWFFIETPLVNTACIFYRKYFCLDCLRCDLVVSTGEIRR